MPDMLVKLYNLEHNWPFIRKAAGAVVIPESAPSVWKDMLHSGEF